ncbi:hypothetical protein G7062_10530 [Erysipelothrix sp. HDW6C]|uniref:hypothetical protein n=1 Tax=Erysipelothrix sp. HDW6C TaxID=2714930 RepID=UPI00140B58C9|nr:hypothetical protein [Erysipelothrix sp. HDW6C]QIK70712.1 hypothetical protein G7062_10530 [Erysipelothrix sp. HDW6C]
MKLFKRTIQTVVVFLLTSLRLSADGEAAMLAVSHLSHLMEFNDLFKTILISLGRWLYDFLAMILDMAERLFSQLMKINLMNVIPEITKVMATFETSLEVVFIVAVLATVFVYLIDQKQIMRILYSAVIVSFLILIFGTVVSLVDDGKTAFMAQIDKSFSTSDNTSDAIFLQNTYDLKYLIREAQNGNTILVTAEAQGIPATQIPFIESTEILTKGEFGYKYTWDDVHGANVASKVRDGVGGVGDQRYLRWRTDYFAVNLTMAIMIVVYIMSALKASHIVVETLQYNLFGKTSLAMSGGDYSKSGKAFGGYISVTLSLLTLYFLTNVFYILAPAVMNIADSTLGLLGKLLILFAFGMTLLMGSDFLDSYFGYSGGGRTLATAYVAKKTIGAASDTAKKGYDKAKGKYDDYRKEQKKLDGLETNQEDLAQDEEKVPSDSEVKGSKKGSKSSDDNSDSSDQSHEQPNVKSESEGEEDATQDHNETAPQPNSNDSDVTDIESPEGNDEHHIPTADDVGLKQSTADEVETPKVTDKDSIQKQFEDNVSEEDVKRYAKQHNLNDDRGKDDQLEADSTQEQK